MKIQDAEQRAYAAYSEQKWNAAKSEMQGLLSLYHQSLQGTRVSEPERVATQYDMLIAYGRLAKIYRESGDLNRAEEVSRLGLKNASTKMREKLKTPKDLDEFVASIDRKQ